MKSCYASCDLYIYCFTVTSISVVILCYHKDKPDGETANTPHNMSDYTNYANNGTVNTAPLTVQMLDSFRNSPYVLCVFHVLVKVPFV